jgi:hypothetical protein
MIDPESSKEILNEAKVLTTEVYKDIAKLALQEVGSVTGRTVKALLFPIRGLLWGWEQIEMIVEEGMKKKFEKIPEERKKSPDPEIAVPLLQALTYTAQNKSLREMYINLLANSMDRDKEKVVHPSFVEIIKQMNTLDAKVFEKLSQNLYYQKIINPTIAVKNENKFLVNALPDWYLGWTIKGYTEFDVSASLVRISKFGLIELMRDITAGTEGYVELKNTQYLIETLNLCKIKNPNLELEIKVSDSVVYVNEYGKQFKSACQ